MSALPRRHLGLTLSALALAGTCAATSLTLVAAPAEAGGQVRTTVSGWSTDRLDLAQDVDHALRLSLRGSARAGRLVALQSREGSASWTTVDRATSSRS